jgi:signal transduction histidine kinase
MRCLRELLYNSAKYSDGKHIRLLISKTESAIHFVVEDKGAGISDADRELMFRFFTKVDDLSEGLGLGLPLAKRHAFNLGGALWLDDTYHEGCRFIIEIPLKQAENDS